MGARLGFILIRLSNFQCVKQKKTPESDPRSFLRCRAMIVSRYMAKELYSLFNNDYWYRALSINRLYLEHIVSRRQVTYTYSFNVFGDGLIQRLVINYAT